MRTPPINAPRIYRARHAARTCRTIHDADQTVDHVRKIQGFVRELVYYLQLADPKWRNQHTTKINMKSNLTLALSLLGFAFATPALVAAEPHHEGTTKEAHADRMLEGYSAVATALYKDDLAATKKAAAGMVKHDKDSAMAKHCQAIADSKTIEEARTHFKALSDAVIPVAKEKKIMHEMHCPMAFGDKGANWLQKSGDEVQNPYFGAKMPHCGKLVKPE
jgi:hypothetical protein